MHTAHTACRVWASTNGRRCGSSRIQAMLSQGVLRLEQLRRKRLAVPVPNHQMMHKMVAHAMILEILEILTVRGVCVVCARASLAMTPIATG